MGISKPTNNVKNKSFTLKRSNVENSTNSGLRKKFGFVKALKHAALEMRVALDGLNACVKSELHVVIDSVKSISILMPA